MGNNAEIFATVKSPSKNSTWRRAKGFSLEEIKQSGRKLTHLKELNIDIDKFRKSAHPENIEALKSLKITEKEIKKREPFVAKEKKRTPFKSKKEKPKVARKRVIEKAPEVSTVKEKVKPVKKEKVKPVKIEKAKIEELGTPLTELPGLGAATAKKFMELGVNTIEDLCKEKPDELASLIKGVSVDRCKSWIEEGKELIK
ncbi:MAG: helix-hairpin-helix domain-containing protein [Candidatus Hermodarchaeota archaeon]